MDLNNKFNTTPIVSSFRNDIELINRKNDLNNIINNKIWNLPYNNINILNNYVNNNFNENNRQ